MGPVVDLLQLGDGDAGIDLGRLQAFMAQEDLHETDVRPTLEHQGGAAMPEEVAGSVLPDAGRLHVAADEAAQVVQVEEVPAATHEHIAFIHRPYEAAPTLFQVLGQPVPKGTTRSFRPFPWRTKRTCWAKSTSGIRR